MNFVKITVLDQQSPSSGFHGTEHRSFNINLDIVVSYVKHPYKLNNQTQFVILFYVVSTAGYTMWTYYSELARDQAFEILEKHIYGYHQALNTDIEYSS